MPVLAAPSEPATAPARRPRWPQAALLACAVLLLHAGALTGLTTPAPLGPQLASPAALQVRQVPQPQPQPAEAATTLAAAGPVRPASTRLGNSDSRSDNAARADPADLASTASAAGASTPVVQEPAVRVPTYTTEPAPAATLVFEIQRGGRRGVAELRWQPRDGRYELELDATDFGPQAPGSASVGGFDAAGLAPERHVDRRRGRDQRAVNFQREGGFISFSGPQLTHTLQAGAQDRLSWMLQLPAILQANPALAAPGAQTSLWVASARGESDVWTFTVQGRQTLDLPGGRVENALHLVRRPQRPFDMQVEVWLDPARHHLPVQLQLALRPGGDLTWLRLQGMSVP